MQFNPSTQLNNFDLSAFVAAREQSEVRVDHEQRMRRGAAPLGAPAAAARGRA